MGNAAGKEFEEKELGETATVDEAKCIAPKLITTAEAHKFERVHKGLSNTVEFKVEGTDEAWLVGKSNAFGSKMSLYDSENAYVALIKCKQGLTTDVSYVYKPTPTYEGQEAVPEKQGPDGEPYYLFAVVNAKRSLTTASATYSVVIGKNEDDGEPTLEPLYKSTKISAMSFMALVETVDGVVVGKVVDAPGFSTKVLLQVVPGVDFAALVITTQALTGGGASAGALAGAGVV